MPRNATSSARPSSTSATSCATRLRRGMGDLTFSQVRDNFEHRHAIGEFQTVAGSEARHRATIDDARNHRRRTSDSRAHAARPEHRRAHHERRTRCVSRRCARVPEPGPAPCHRGDTDLTRSNPRLAGTRGQLARRPRSKPSAKLPSTTATPSQGFAPTARAAHQLREAAGISADTLQAYSGDGNPRAGADQPRRPGKPPPLSCSTSPVSTSTQQMKEFLDQAGSAGSRFAYRRHTAASGRRRRKALRATAGRRNANRPTRPDRAPERPGTAQSRRTSCQE